MARLDRRQRGGGSEAPGRGVGGTTITKLIPNQVGDAYTLISSIDWTKSIVWRFQSSYRRMWFGFHIWRILEPNPDLQYKTVDTHICVLERWLISMAWRAWLGIASNIQICFIDYCSQIYNIYRYSSIGSQMGKPIDKSV